MALSLSLKRGDIAREEEDATWGPTNKSLGAGNGFYLFFPLVSALGRDKYSIMGSLPQNAFS